jgi:hypothetical protein
MQTSLSFRSLWLGVAVLGLVAVSSREAHASPVFPGALQEAADMECVPLCTMCHTVNPGTAGTWTQPVGIGVKGATVPGSNPPIPILKIGDEESLKAAFKVYSTSPGVDAATLAKIKQGIEPKSGQNVCGPIYGCAIPLVAKHPARSRDYTAALWVVSAMVVGGILRRRRKTNAS